ncbi:NADPH-dependent FMN reductase [Kitasatospora sp. MMS16-BH015]|uniref:NADPH-dependent FMN reductase n=1 Tax=Kitasatospora sp. MMS16-BH015 TaxID=2018025 RepID=UPI000CA1C6C4|nr:NAD(P)H-dependent oxidoreductase [Kitasatospora sp. MMS16-BH015]AUG78520.1 NADPH-dependent FMN reductase [Kitasatospora sp. MMS16-BH015]
MPVTTPVRLAIIIGSTRPGRFAPTIARWAAEQADHYGFELDLIDLAETGLPHELGDPSAEGRAAVAALSTRLHRADAFLVLTPEYNHSFPAPLKQAIDSFRPEWAAKPVAFVSYGGISGGLRAVEQLRLVFAELHATTIRNTVSFQNAGARFDADGRPVDAADTNLAMKEMLHQLDWWAQALRTARATTPYGQNG